MRKLKIITGVILLLISMCSGVALLFTEFVMVTEVPQVLRSASVLYPLVIFIVAGATAAFLTPRCFQFHLLLVSAIYALFQLGFFHWTPLIVAFAVLLPLMVMQPRWFRWGFLIPALSFAVLAVDAFAFHHRFAVFAHTMRPFTEVDPSPKIMRSPSGKTTAYLLSGGFLDAFYTVCISSNRIMPVSCFLPPSGLNGSTSSDIIAKWDGPVFLAGDKLLSFAWDERNNTATSYDSWTRGAHYISDPPKTREAFSKHLLSLPPKK